MNGIILEKLREIAASRERYLEAWIAETGLKPSEAMQVTADVGGGIKIYWAMKTGLPTEIAVLQGMVEDLREQLHAANDRAEHFAAKAAERAGGAAVAYPGGRYRGCTRPGRLRR